MFVSIFVRLVFMIFIITLREPLSDWLGVGLYRWQGTQPHKNDALVLKSCQGTGEAQGSTPFPNEEGPKCLRIWEVAHITVEAKMAAVCKWRSWEKPGVNPAKDLRSEDQGDGGINPSLRTRGDWHLRWIKKAGEFFFHSLLPPLFTSSKELADGHFQKSTPRDPPECFLNMVGRDGATIPGKPFMCTDWAVKYSGLTASWPADQWRHLTRAHGLHTTF